MDLLERQGDQHQPPVVHGPHEGQRAKQGQSTACPQPVSGGHRKDQDRCQHRQHCQVPGDVSPGIRSVGQDRVHRFRDSAKAAYGQGRRHQPDQPEQRRGSLRRQGSLPEADFEPVPQAVPRRGVDYGRPQSVAVQFPGSRHGRIGPGDHQRCPRMPARVG